MRALSPGRSCSTNAPPPSHEAEVADHAAAAIEHDDDGDRLDAALENRDVLQLAVVVDLEIAALQVRHQLAFGIRDGHVHGDGPGAASKYRLLAFRLRGHGQCRAQRGDERDHNAHGSSRGAPRRTALLDVTTVGARTHLPRGGWTIVAPRPCRNPAFMAPGFETRRVSHGAPEWSTRTRRLPGRVDVLPDAGIVDGRHSREGIGGKRRQRGGGRIFARLRGRLRARDRAGHARRTSGSTGARTAPGSRPAGHERPQRFDRRRARPRTARPTTSRPCRTPLPRG